MDLKKCRTCFIDLDANDLFLKLDQVHKNSKLSLGEKLKLCVPQMDLRYSDKLYICMQCSMHLETAYAFHMTCLKTEEEVQRHISQVFHNIQDSKKSDKCYVKEEENKDIVAMHCHICNINFISRNIFDLHMRVMHHINKSKCNNNDELDGSKSKKIKSEELHNSIEGKVEIPKNQKRIEILKSKTKSDLENKRKSDVLKDKKRPLVQMVLLQTNIESSLIKEKKRNYLTSDKGKGAGSKRNIEELREVRRIVANTLETRDKGRFKPKSTLEANMKTRLNNIEVNTKIMKKTEQENKSSKTTKYTFRKCKFCPRRIATAGALTQHIIACHKEKCNRCNVCKRYFIHIDQHKKTYGCHLQQPKQRKVSSLLQQDQNNCKLTSTKYCFSQDARFYYMQDKHRICLICRKAHSSESSLKSHMDSNHTGGVSCKKCDLGFSACNYSVHVVLGCGRSPFFNYTTDGECICPLCNKVLNKVTTLFRHLSTQHSSEKLSCNVCKKIFDTFRLYGDHFTSSCANTIAEHQRDSTVIVKDEHKSNNLLRTRAQTSVRDNSKVIVQGARKPNKSVKTRTQTSEQYDSTVFVEVGQESKNLRIIPEQASVKDPLATKLCQNEVNTSDSVTYNDQLDNSNTSGSSGTIVDIILDKSVKVEPTQLLDQNLFMAGEESIINNQLAAAPGVDLQFLNNEEEIMDSPELIYILPENKAID